MNPLRILIADDHELLRNGIRGVLATRPEWTVCGEAATGQEVVRLAQELKPDIIILDITMPGLSGLQAARQIRETLPACQLLVLTVHESTELIRELLSLGGRGYVLKSDAGRDLIQAVEALGSGQSFFTARVSSLMLDQWLRANDGTAPAIGILTAREREIVRWVAEGKTSKEIGNELSISPLTVDTHRANIMHKLKLRSVAELVRYAIRSGIVSA
jgi:DNA-binding NarL/FixJ family response regulator